MICRVLLAALMAVWAGISAVSPALAADDPQAAPGDVVVATVNGTEIYLSDVKESRDRLPERYQELPPRTIFGLLVNSLIDSKLAAAEARREGLHETAEVKRRLARVEEQILERSLLVQRITKGLSEEALQERYRTLAEKTEGQEQMQARHILVDTEARAKGLIAELKNGGDFAELAKSNSIGPSAAKGGDLGYFTRGDMLAEFSDAAFKLADGEITEEPVRTQYGWHVIKAVARRAAVPPPFAAVAEQLRNELSREIGAGVMENLRATAAIQRFNPDGSPLEANASTE